VREPFVPKVWREGTLNRNHPDVAIKPKQGWQCHPFLLSFFRQTLFSQPATVLEVVYILFTLSSSCMGPILPSTDHPLPSFLSLII
jgi:hypothetical protein